MIKFNNLKSLSHKLKIFFNYDNIRKTLLKNECFTKQNILLSTYTLL